MNVRNWLSQNLILKTISIVLAIILWVYVQGESRSEIIFNLPLKIVKASNMAIFGDVPEYVRVTLRGRRNVINGLGKEQFRVELDLSDREPSKISYRLTPKNISGPKDVNIANINPDQITIELDYLVSKEVPIKTITTGHLASNFLIYDFIIVPPTVIIEGAARELKVVNHIETVPILVDGARDSFTREVNLKPERKIKTKSTSETKVTIVVWKEKKFPKHEITLLNLGDNLQARPLPATLSISVKGPEKQIDILQTDDVNIMANLDQLPPGTYQRRIEISLPPGVEYSEYNPKTINVTIRPKDKE